MVPVLKKLVQNLREGSSITATSPDPDPSQGKWFFSACSWPTMAFLTLYCKRCSEYLSLSLNHKFFEGEGELYSLITLSNPKKALNKCFLMSK